jgi:uncharacterized RDD family membrane protein YckC
MNVGRSWFPSCEDNVGFFKQKKENASIVVTCGHCGERLVVVDERCKNCKQKIENDKTAPGTALAKASSALEATASKSTSQPAARQLSESQTGPAAGLKTAPVRRRVVAAAIDHSGVLVAAFVIEILSLLPIMHYFTCARSLLVLPGLPAIGLVYIPLLACFAACAFPIIYFAWFESGKRQATPGKRAMGLKVVGLRSRDISFGRALAKSIIQYVVLYILSVMVALVAVLAVFSLPVLKGMSFMFHIFDAILAVFILCVPFFRGGRQSIVDCVLGRMVVEDSEISEEVWSEHLRGLGQPGAIAWTPRIESCLLGILVGIIFSVIQVCAIVVVFAFYLSPLGLISLLIPVVLLVFWLRTGDKKWDYFRTGLLATTCLSLAAGMVIALPYDFLLIQKSAQSMPIAEQAFKIDSQGKDARASRLLKQAIQLNPDLFLTYQFFSSCAEVTGQSNLSKELLSKSMILKPPRGNKPVPLPPK